MVDLCAFAKNAPEGTSNPQAARSSRAGCAIKSLIRNPLQYASNPILFARIVVGGLTYQRVTEWQIIYKINDGTFIFLEGTWVSLFHGDRNKSSLDYRAVNFRALSPIGFSWMAANINLSTWDVTADGQRFFMPAAVAEGTPSPFNVILNWTSLLKK